jgi:uncharacterized membrane protein
MLEKMKKVTFWLALISVIKLVSQMFNVSIPDELWNDIANGLASIFTLIGVIVDHGQPKAENQQQ